MFFLCIYSGCKSSIGYKGTQKDVLCEKFYCFIAHVEKYADENSSVVKKYKLGDKLFFLEFLKTLSCQLSYDAALKNKIQRHVKTSLQLALTTTVKMGYPYQKKNLFIVHVWDFAFKMIGMQIRWCSFYLYLRQIYTCYKKCLRDTNVSQTTYNFLNCNNQDGKKSI